MRNQWIPYKIKPALPRKYANVSKCDRIDTNTQKKKSILTQYLYYVVKYLNPIRNRCIICFIIIIDLRFPVYLNVKPNESV